MASVSEDVTAERELREALRESEKLFRLLAENSTDVIGRLSADQRIEYVSPASRAVYGYEPEAMIGRFGWEYIHPDDLAAMRADFSARAGPEVVTNTYRVLRGDGTHVCVEAKIRALHDPASGELVEFHTVARDVGERSQAELDVRRAKEEAELANAAKSEFLSRMSHELRTPLHAILGFGELLARGDADPRQREQLAHIMSAGRHLLELINEVLDLSRIEGGELHLSLESVHVGEVVGEALEMLGPSPAARSVALVRAAARRARRLRARRPPAPQAGAAQPAVQRREVQPRRRRGARRRASRRAPDRARIEVADTGHRDRRRRPRAGVRRVRAARRGGDRRRGHGPRARADAPADRGDGRDDRRRQRGRSRHDVLAGSPGGGRARGRAGESAGQRGGDPRRGRAHRRAHDPLHRGRPVEHQARRDDPRRAPRGDAARRAAGQPRPGARARAHARARAAGPPPARRLGRGGLAPAARRSAHGRHLRRDGQRGRDVRPARAPARGRRGELPHQAV